ncbi:MAG: phytanoyl-CoA dioxygenase family protein [Hyphomicrobiaceae bacterium]
MANIRERYERDGFVYPITVMSEVQAGNCRSQLEDFERTFGQEQQYRRCIKRYPNLVMPFIDEISRLPAITDAIAEILGPDLLALDAPFFIKEPRTEAYVSWHQDLHYWGLEGEEEVTAWVALSPATAASGCMRFVPGSHTRIVEHTNTHAEDNMLSLGQEVAVDVDEAETVDAELKPGEMSIHHGRVFHASHPNTTGDRRIGLAIRYMPTSMKQRPGGTMSAMLVRGEDKYGHFRPCRRPSGLLQEDDYKHWLEVSGARVNVIMKGDAEPTESAS